MSGYGMKEFIMDLGEKGMESLLELFWSEKLIRRAASYSVSRRMYWLFLGMIRYCNIESIMKLKSEQFAFGVLVSFI
jgi:hypothetical protein